MQRTLFDEDDREPTKEQLKDLERDFYNSFEPEGPYEPSDAFDWADDLPGEDGDEEC